MIYAPRTGLQRPRYYARLIEGVTEAQLAKIDKHPHGHTMQDPSGRWWVKFREHGALPNQVASVFEAEYTQEEAAAMWAIEWPEP